MELTAFCSLDSSSRTGSWRIISDVSASIHESPYTVWRFYHTKNYCIEIEFIFSGAGFTRSGLVYIALQASLLPASHNNSVHIQIPFIPRHCNGEIFEPAPYLEALVRHVFLT